MNPLFIIAVPLGLVILGMMLVKEFATRIEVREDTASYWQLVFLQSKANGCSYRAENLPHLKWQWPKGTWFQQQRRHRLHAGKFAGHQ